jgi:hypothetical protein
MVVFIIVLKNMQTAFFLHSIDPLGSATAVLKSMTKHSIPPSTPLSHLTLAQPGQSSRCEKPYHLNLAA